MKPTLLLPAALQIRLVVLSREVNGVPCITSRFSGDIPLPSEAHACGP
jgi:hypothetical protein